MEQIHSLPDGTKLAVWEERNQAMALHLPFRRGTGALVLARDVLKDLISVRFGNTVYYAYHSLEHRIMFGVAGEGAPTAILSDAADERRYSELTLLEWKEELWLFFRGWKRTEKRWELKAMRPISEREGKTVWDGFLEPVEPVYAVSGDKFIILAEGKICTWDGKHPPEAGEILQSGTGRKARDAILRLEAENRRQKIQIEAIVKKQEAQLSEVKKQYDELAAYASELQKEGRRWREKYYRKN